MDTVGQHGESLHLHQISVLIEKRNKQLSITARICALTYIACVKFATQYESALQMHNI